MLVSSGRIAMLGLLRRTKKVATEETYGTEVIVSYTSKTLKMLLEEPDAVLLADKFQQIACLSAIHPVFQLSATS